MENTFTDDRTQRENPAVPLQAAPQNTIMDFIRKNAVIVTIIIIILLFLIYWFCMRKSTPPVIAETNLNLAAAPGTTRTIITNAKAK